MKDFKSVAGGGMILAAFVVSACASMNWDMATQLYAHRKARHVGDLLTVRIVESSNVEKDASRSTRKSFSAGGSASFGRPQIDDRPAAWTNFSLPQFSMSGSRDFSGQGSVEDNDKFESYITVRVRDVLPNGDLLVEGKRTLALKEETIHMFLSGAVRVRDIDNRNTVESTKIADAVIQYKSAGTVERSARPGLVPRVIDWINPF